MVQAIINLGQSQDRTLNIVKGKFGFKNKSEAVNFIIHQYQEECLEPELHPEYIEKIENIEKNGKFSKYSSLLDLKNELENA